MIFASPTFVLIAVDIGTVFTAVFLIVLFLGWVLQAVQNQKEGGGPRQPGRQRPNQPRQRPNQPRQRLRDDRVASEIDAFLREVNSSRGNVDEEDEPLIEVVREPTRRPRRRQPEPAPPRPPATRSQRGRPVTTGPSDIESHAAELGSGLRSHVQSYMADHLEQDVDAHLGDRAAEMPVEIVVAQPEVHPLVARLRDPQGARNAILLAEVLTRPRTFRDR